MKVIREYLIAINQLRKAGYRHVGLVWVLVLILLIGRVTVLDTPEFKVGGDLSNGTPYKVSGYGRAKIVQEKLIKVEPEAVVSQ